MIDNGATNQPNVGWRRKRRCVWVAPVNGLDIIEKNEALLLDLIILNLSMP
jgi:hypothetical protein